ncbi:MAG: exodeoxyribonuclease VII small subunit [Deltaproteobacteria bacterium]|nr:exodeoxyribonuclease VII small subunit [Deltaproteobacteria bacterium]
MIDVTNRKFEDALRVLEGIVEKLETGDLSLDEALGAFEDGVTLVRHLGEKLTEVEKRVEVLTREPSGLFQLQNVVEDEDEDE